MNLQKKRMRKVAQMKTMKGTLILAEKIITKKATVSWKNFLDASKINIQFTSYSENFAFLNFVTKPCKLCNEC